MKQVQRASLLFFLLFGTLLAAEEIQAPKIRATLKQTDATVGDVLEYKVSISGKNIGKVNILLPEDRVAYPGKKEVPGKVPAKQSEDGSGEDPADSVPLYIIHNAKKDDRSDKDVTDITVILQMSYYRPGKHALPEVEIQDTDKVKIGYKIPEVTIKSLNEKGEFQEIEPPLALSGNYTRLILLLIGAIALTLVGVFLYKKIKERIEELKAQVPIIPAYELFEKDMQTFQAKELIENGSIEAYVFGISTIFRRYLSREFSFDALDMTSDEILIKLKKLLDKERYLKYADGIEKSFNLWDLSKFAEFAPSKEMLLLNYKLVDKLVYTMAKDSGYGADGV